MIDAISGLGGIKSAMEAVKSFNTTITDVAIAEAKLEILGHLSEARQALLDNQQTLLECSDTIRSLEAKIVHFEDWSCEAAQYEPKNTGQGALAYRLKSSDPAEEDGHWLCPNCFHERKKSFLQPETLAVGRTRLLRCHPCGQEIITRGTREQPPARRR